jgi:hypothetical protein
MQGNPLFYYFNLTHQEKTKTKLSLFLRSFFVEVKQRRKDAMRAMEINNAQSQSLLDRIVNTADI